MARHGRAHVLETVAKPEPVAIFREIVGKVAHQRAGIVAAEKRRHLADDDRARPEPLDDESELLELGGPGAQAVGRGLVKLHDLGNQEPLPFHPPASRSAFMRS